jgi:hypothetical protein
VVVNLTTVYILIGWCNGRTKLFPVSNYAVMLIIPPVVHLIM